MSLRRIDSCLAESGFRALICAFLLIANAAFAQSSNDPYTGTRSVQPTELDNLINRSLRRNNLSFAPSCSDAVFLRRVYLDIIGTLPEPAETTAFLSDSNPRKRAALIDELLERDEYAYYWAMRWGDALRIKSEFPINLWPNAVQAYHRWVQDAMRENMRYDRFVRELLTSSGSNFRVSAVNFFRAVQGNEAFSLAHGVALTFLCSRLEGWPEDRAEGLNALFSRMTFKPTAEWKEQIVMFDASITDDLIVKLPDGEEVTIPPDQDPRVVFADWLIKGKGQKWMCWAIVNRMWSWMFGRGLIHETDDIRPGNSPVHPEAFNYLSEGFAKGGYDLKRLIRAITNSRTYQQSCVPAMAKPKSSQLFACYPVRRLSAEVLIDGLCQLTNTTESYSSPIPEPFTFIPEHQRTLQLADGSITSAFLDMFGRPPRDTGLVSERNMMPSDQQALHMLNSSHVQNKIAKSPKINKLIADAGSGPEATAEAVYIAVLSRPPTRKEVSAAVNYCKTAEAKGKLAAHDLIWALVNSKEFLYHH